MGYLGYGFVNLSAQQIATRRLALDQHAQIAQFSQLFILLWLVALRYGSLFITRWTNGDNDRVPSSPQKKYLSENRSRIVFSNLTRKWRIFIWKLDNEIVRGFGTWGQWIGGLIWTIWLLFLCFLGSAPDYMHLTKSFGLVAASQLPLHYLLAMKSPYSPIQLLLRTSHENLNPSHRVLGRVIMLFMFLHAGFYLNFFIITGFWDNRFKDRDVILGLISISIVGLIGVSALRFVRRWNYRLFFAIHAVAPIVLLSLLFFHVQHIRVYVAEAMIAALVNIALRVWSSKSVPAQISSVPGSSLICMDLESHASNRSWAAGNHVYIRRKTGLASYSQANPFTIASLPHDSDKVELVARVLKGNTKKLVQCMTTNSSFSKTMPITLSMEGPYGQSNHLPSFEKFEKLLFVAGGIGATFILPLWQQALQTRDQKAPRRQNVKFIWSVKQPEDASWAFANKRSIPHPVEPDEREIYVSSSKMHAGAGEGHGSVELTSIENPVNFALQAKDKGFSIHKGRPNFSEAVDELIAGTSGQVAVFICGPSSMGRSLRRHVGRWVVMGKDVYWHTEDFGL